MDIFLKFYCICKNHLWHERENWNGKSLCGRWVAGSEGRRRYCEAELRRNMDSGGIFFHIPWAHLLSVIINNFTIFIYYFISNFTNNVDHGTFCPLVFTTAGAASPECAKFLQRLCGMLAHLDSTHYAQTVWYVHCRLSFALLRASIMCLRGSRSAYHRPVNALRELAVVEGQAWDTLPYISLDTLSYISFSVVVVVLWWQK